MATLPTTSADAFFVFDEGRYVATELTRGPWDATLQHGGPPAALLGREIERADATNESVVARITFEILRPIPIDRMDVSATVVRGGRNVQLLTGSLTVDGVEVMRATAWRIRVQDDPDVATPEMPESQLPATLEAARLPWSAAVGYHTAMDWRFATGGLTEPGPGVAWLRMRHPLVSDETPSPLTRVLVAADSTSGIGSAVDFSDYVAINTDLSVYLHRLPAGEWIGLKASTAIGPSGVGVATAEICDEQSVAGRSLQALLVRKR